MIKQNLTQIEKNMNKSDQEKPLTAIIASILHDIELNHIKIEMIKEEVASGRYRINDEHIAFKMTEFMSIIDEESMLELSSPG